MKRKLENGEVEMSLSAWLCNHSIVQTAKDCGVTRQTISRLRKDGRKFYIYVKGGTITYAYELVGSSPVWRWKNSPAR